MTPSQLRAGAEQSRKVAQELEQKVSKVGVFAAMGSDRMMGILAVRDLFQGVGQVLDAMADAAPGEDGDAAGKNAA